MLFSPNHNHKNTGQRWPQIHKLVSQFVGSPIYQHYHVFIYFCWNYNLIISNLTIHWFLDYHLFVFASLIHLLSNVAAEVSFLVWERMGLREEPGLMQGARPRIITRTLTAVEGVVLGFSTELKLLLRLSCPVCIYCFSKGLHASFWEDCYLIVFSLDLSA